jgi:hypothetical protein
MKKIIVHFDFPNATLTQYEAVWKELRTAGYGKPKGMIYHSGAPKPEGGLIVVDIWESEDDYQAFSRVLKDVTEKYEDLQGIPKIYPVHYQYEQEEEITSP